VDAAVGVEVANPAAFHRGTAEVRAVRTLGRRRGRPAACHHAEQADRYAEAAATPLARIPADASQDAYDAVEEAGPGTIRYSYRLDDSDDGSAAALYGFAMGEHGHVKIVVYFDNESTLPFARDLLRSLRETP
jgi:hypothetical protein